MKTSLLFNFDLDNNNILSCFLFIFLFINLYFLIHAVIAQIFNPIAEIVISMGTPLKEEKAKNEIHLVIAEAKIRKRSI